MAKPRKTGKRGQGEGAIYRRESDGRWVAAVDLGWQDGKRQRKVVYGATHEEVAVKLLKLKIAQHEGKPIKVERQSVGAFLDRWHADVIVPNRRPGTARRYRSAITTHLAPAFRDKPIESLTAQDVQSLLSRMRRTGLAAETVSSVHSVLRLALDQAVRWDMATRNVAALVDRPRIEREGPNPLTPDEARRVLQAVAPYRLAAAYELSIRLGLRQAETLGLCWRDVDLETGHLAVRQQLQWIDKQPQFVPPKSERSRRVIELTPPVVAALRRHRERQAAEGLAPEGPWRDLVFLSVRGAPLRHTTITGHLKRTLVRLGIPERRWHDLRHTAVTLMLAAGVPERVIMEIMGHSRLDMTRLYGKVLAASRRDAVARLDDLLASAEPDPNPDGYIFGYKKPQPIVALPSETPKRRAKP